MRDLRNRTARVIDAVMAGERVEHGLPVVSRDGDFERLAAVHQALRVKAV